MGFTGGGLRVGSGVPAQAASIISIRTPIRILVGLPIFGSPKGLVAPGLILFINLRRHVAPLIILFSGLGLMPGLDLGDGRNADLDAGEYMVRHVGLGQQSSGSTGSNATE